MAKLGSSQSAPKSVERQLGRFRRILRSPIVRSGSFGFVVATGAVSASNFLFHAVISRMIGPSGYGILGSILNLLLVLSVPLGALQVAATQATVEWEEQGATVDGLRRLVLKVGFAGLLATAAVDLVSPWIAGYLHMSGTVNIYVLSLWILPAVLSAVLQGVLMGQRRFGAVALANLLGGGLARIAAGVLLVLFGLGVTGAVAASAISQLVLLLLLVPVSPLRDNSNRQEGRANRIGVGESLRTVLALGGYWVLISMDTVMGRHYLVAKSAGLYASAATLGRIALFLPGAIALIALPMFAKGKGLSQEARDTLRWSVPATLGLSSLAAVVIGVFPAVLARVLFGGAFVQAAPAVRLLGVEAAALGLVGLLVYYLLARRSMLAFLPWAGALAAFLLVFRYHTSMTSIAWVMLLCASVVAVAMLVGAAAYLMSHPLAPASTSHGGLFSGEAPAYPDVPEISVVIPFYNPGPALCRQVADLAGSLEEAGVAFELIAVSDGSTDGSLEELVAGSAAIKGLRIIELHENCGKGQALRVGLSNGRGRYVGFIDADGDIPASQMERLIEVIRVSAPDVVTGSKRHPESNVVYPPIRRLYSWGFQQVLRGFFDLTIRDTQTGLKLVRRDVLEKVLPLMVEKRFAFDVEMFAVAQRLGFSDFVEVPVTIRERITTTISPRGVWRIFVDTAGIFYRLRIIHFYDRSTPTETLESIQSVG